MGGWTRVRRAVSDGVYEGADILIARCWGEEHPIEINEEKPRTPSG